MTKYTTENPNKESLSVVGVGASAGGLDALSKLLSVFTWMEADLDWSSGTPDVVFDVIA